MPDVSIALAAFARAVPTGALSHASVVEKAIKPLIGVEEFGAWLVDQVG